MSSGIIILIIYDNILVVVVITPANVSYSCVMSHLFKSIIDFQEIDSLVRQYTVSSGDSAYLSSEFNTPLTCNAIL